MNSKKSKKNTIKKTREDEFQPYYLSNNFTDRLFKYGTPLLTEKLGLLENNNLIEIISAIGLGEPFKGKLNERTKQEQFILDLIYDYLELTGSIEKLHIGVVQTKRIRGNRDVKKHRLLSYYFENSILEIGIYTQRITKLFRKLSKFCKKKKLLAEAKEIDKNLKLFLNVFEGLTIIRNTHVHDTRYRDNSIIRIDVLNTFSSLESFSKIDLIRNTSEEIYKKRKKELTKTMDANIRGIQSNTDIYFNNITEIVFEKLYKKMND